jgi:zinc finger CCHC domain-containing protein 8
MKAHSNMIQRPFQLDIVDIHSKEEATQAYTAWKKKYVYWIPALHLDGQEIAKGRWDATDVTKALEQWDLNQQQAESTSEKPENKS